MPTGQEGRDGDPNRNNNARWEYVTGKEGDNNMEEPQNTNIHNPFFHSHLRMRCSPGLQLPNLERRTVIKALDVNFDLLL